AERQGSQAGKPRGGSRRSQFSVLWELRQHRQGAERFSRTRMARQRGTALLCLPHHGRVGDDFYSRGDCRGFSALAQQAPAGAQDALGADAQVPFPYIATTAGWWTAELGRQPWVVHGLLRTEEAGFPRSTPAMWSLPRWALQACTWRWA